jgi:hypothetical protein
MSDQKPLISPESAGYLAQVVNRVADSFDVAALSDEEAIELYLLLDRLSSALWEEHKRTLLPLFLGLMTSRTDWFEEDDSDDSDGSGGSTH